MSNNWVFSVLQDRRGFLWVGTWDGLNQFDGRDFNVYLHDDASAGSPAGREIKCLAEDSYGKIWMGTENGACALDPISGLCTHFPFDRQTGERAAFPGINSLAITHDTIMAGGNGLFVVRPETGTAVPAPGELNARLFEGTDHVVNSILPDGNRLWLGTSLGVLVYFPQNRQWTRVAYEGKRESLPGLDYINALTLDDEGVLWAASWGAGLLRIDTARMAIVDYYLPQPDKTDASHNILNGIAMTGQPADSQLLWISGVTGGLFSFDKTRCTFRAYGSGDPEDAGNVYQEGYSVCFLPGTGLWIGTRIGLYHFDPQQQLFTEISPIQTDNENIEHYFSTVYADPADTSGSTLLLCTNNLGLYEFNARNGQVSQINHLFGRFLRPEIYVSDIYRDASGDLWIATLLEGLKRAMPGGRMREAVLTDHTGDTVRWINEILDVSGQAEKLWVATDRGLFLMDKESGNYRQVPIAGNDSSVSGTSVFALTNASDGSLVFIGYDKLQNAEFIARISGDSLKAEIVIGPFSPSDPQHIRMTDLAPGAEDEIVVSSHHGLYLFREADPASSFMRFSHDHQGIRSRLEQLQTDRYGNVWALAYDDLYLLDIVTRQLHRIEYEDLKKNARLNLNLNAITGDIMLGSWDKVYIIRNDSILINGKPLRTYITAIRAGGEDSQGYSTSLNGNRIVLPYRSNSLTVEYTAINFRKGSMNEYAYRMKGLNQDWTFTSNESVSYRLPPGKYQFQLRCRTAGGMWDESFVYTDIVIRPPFYRTIWFGLIILFLAASIVYLVYRYRINQLLRLQKMRDNISRDLHDDIGSSLTNIAIMNEMAVQETRRGGDPEKILSKSAEDIHEVISSLSDIVWNVNPEYDDLKFLLARMRRYALDLLENTDIVYELDIFEPEQKITMNMEQRRDFYMVFKEGLNNLVKYSGARNAWVSIALNNDILEMIIRDDGKGFEPEKVSFGNGMKNMRQRTEAWKGEFRVESSPGQGTGLRFKIPVKN